MEKVPRWIEENKSQYIKYLRSFIHRLENKQYRSEYEEKRLASLKKRLERVENDQ